MKKVVAVILIVAMQVVFCAAALAEIGTYESDAAVFHGVVENGAPAGLGYSEYYDGSLVVGIFGANCEANGFAVHVGAADYFYDVLSAGFFDGGFTSLFGCMNYTDINGNSIAVGPNDARGSLELCYGTRTYDTGVYYGEMDLDRTSPHGYGIMQWNDGGYSAGVWVNGTLQGYAVDLEADGSGYMGYFVDNVLNGYAYGYAQDGTCYLYRFENGEQVEVCNGGYPISSAYTYMEPEDLAAYYVTGESPQTYDSGADDYTPYIYGYDDIYSGLDIPDLYPDDDWTGDYAYPDQETICVGCYGSGSCNVCNGTGTYSNYGFSDVCSACGGTGICSICGGTGSY